jgi:hypothetical protein
MSEARMDEPKRIDKYIKTKLLDALEELRPPRPVRRSAKPVEFSEIIARIDRSSSDAAIKQLFEYVGSDYRDPKAWHAMIGLFADEFLIERKGGAPKLWDRPSAITLRRDFIFCARRNPSRSGKQIVEKMKELYPKRYAAPVGTILRWLSVEGIGIKAVKKSITVRPGARK